MVEINLCSIVFMPRILDLSQAVTLTKIQNKVKYLIWNYIRLWFVKKISISSPVKSLGYIKCYSLSSLSPIKPINVFLEFFAYWRKVIIEMSSNIFSLTNISTWMYVIIMLHMHFRVNPHSIFSWMSRNSLHDNNIHDNTW